MKTVWLIKNKYFVSQNLESQFLLFEKAFSSLGVQFAVKTNDELCITSTFSQALPSAVIMWDKDIILARRLEMLGVMVINSADSIACCDDKMLMQLAFSKADLPCPQTIYAPMTFSNIGYTDYTFVAQAAATLSFPMVIKQANSSYGMGVFKADNLSDAETIVKSISYPMLFQEFIAESSGRDIRVYVVGEKVICAALRSNAFDFRSNIALGGSMQQISLTNEIIDLSLKAARAVGCDFCGLDLLYSKRGLLVCEVNTSAHIGTILSVTGINMAEQIASYTLAKITKSNVRQQ